MIMKDMSKEKDIKAGVFIAGALVGYFLGNLVFYCFYCFTK